MGRTLEDMRVHRVQAVHMYVGASRYLELIGRCVNGNFMPIESAGHLYFQLEIFGCCCLHMRRTNTGSKGRGPPSVLAGQL